MESLLGIEDLTMISGTGKLFTVSEVMSKWLFSCTTW